jgi:hypothetical protein
LCFNVKHRRPAGTATKGRTIMLYGIRNTATGNVSKHSHYLTLAAAESAIERGTCDVDELEAVELDAFTGLPVDELEYHALYAAWRGDRITHASYLARMAELELPLDDHRRAIELARERRLAEPVDTAELAAALAGDPSAKFTAEQDAELEAARELERETGRYVRAIELGSPIAVLELVRHLIARNENGYVNELQPFEARPILEAIAVALDSARRLGMSVLELTGAAELSVAGDAGGAQSRDEAEFGPIMAACEPVGPEANGWTIAELYTAWRTARITDEAYELELERRGVTSGGVELAMRGQA